jgi:hypothetical protein
MSVEGFREISQTPEELYANIPIATRLASVCTIKETVKRSRYKFACMQMAELPSMVWEKLVNIV